MNYAARQAIYRSIEKERQSKVIALVNSERMGLETIIARDAVAPFVALLDQIKPTKKLSVILDTNGGHTAAAWRLINMIRSFGDEIEDFLVAYHAADCKKAKVVGRLDRTEAESVVRKAAQP